MVDENVSTTLVVLVVGKVALIVVVTKLLETVFVVTAGCNTCELFKEAEVDEVTFLTANGPVSVLGDDDLFTGATAVGVTDGAAVVLPITQHRLDTFASTDCRV